MNENDFKKRFGSNSPLPPYNWSDDDYASGWDITGDMPPTRQQFDALQRTNDDKAAYLLDKVYSSARLLKRSAHYNKGDRVYAEGLKAGLYLECATAGMSGTDAIDLSSAKVGDTITDGGVAWAVVKYALTTDVPPLASALATPRKIELTGNVTGSADFDGSQDIQIATSLSDVSALAHSLLSKTTAADMRGVIEANAQNCGGIVAESLTSPGYVKFANGFIIEWARVGVDHAPGTDNIDTAYHKWWNYPIKMSVPICALATDTGGNYYNPQPLCTWATDDPNGIIVNCPIARTAAVIAIGIA